MSTDDNQSTQADQAQNPVLVENRGTVTWITLNRPESMNSLDPNTHKALRDALQNADIDPQTRAIVLTGAGQKAFCAGGDVKGMVGKDSFGGKERVLSVGRDLIDILTRLEKPIIAAVNGVAAGLGATIALYCDIVMMADSARIGDRHVNVGLVAGDGGSAIWPLLIGPARAKEYLMTGELIPATEAAEMGLVSRCVPAGELTERAGELAEKLASRPPYAVRATKIAINKMVQLQTAQVMDLSLAYEHLSMRTEDHQEALQAFLEKRPGNFTGH